METPRARSRSRGRVASVEEVCKPGHWKIIGKCNGCGHDGDTWKGCHKWHDELYCKGCWGDFLIIRSRGRVASVEEVCKPGHWKIIGKCNGCGHDGDTWKGCGKWHDELYCKGCWGNFLTGHVDMQIEDLRLSFGRKIGLGNDAES